MPKEVDVLDQTFGQAIEIWTSLPPIGQAGAVIAVGIGAAVYYMVDQDEEDERLEASDWQERMENIFKIPAEETGAKVNDLLIKEGDSSTKRTLGAVKRLQKSTIRSDGKLVKEEVDDETWKEIKENDFKDLDIEGVTYAWIKGDKKLDRIISGIEYKLYSIFTSGSNPKAEYIDIPVDYLEITDRGIVISDEAHLFKKNGLWQVAASDAQRRITELSFVGHHQNSMESMQKLPEFYSDYNMKISGQKNIMNTKSQNMREYKKNERLQDKEEAMED